MIVNELPPNVDCETVSILKALNKASRVLGELKGEVSKIPNSKILVDTLALQEAKDSNEIENIVTTDDELYQASIDGSIASKAAKEALSYAHALHVGINKLKNNGLITVNDIVEVQSIITPNHPVRKLPGTVLKNQQSGEVIFTPPQHHDDILRLLRNLEIYINTPEFHKIDPLIKMPIIHFQFESIHPFYDGNGRTGRLLNMLYLVQQKLLDIPVLYLSGFIIKNKSDYYRLLQEVRTMNNWEEWIVWMLKGVEETAKETIVVVNKIKNLMNRYKVLIRDNFNFYSHDLINCLFKHPYTKIDFLEGQLNIHRNTAGSYLRKLETYGLLTKVKIGRGNYYINVELLNILKNR
ncbi:MAG: Fic family protein [Proteobacteria bacterium]|nr:Fic family protein [Pseudomonadota bacterium]